MKGPVWLWAGVSCWHGFCIEFDREDDGRWIAEISQLPGVMVYGSTKAEAEARVQALALRVVAEQLEKDAPPIDHVGFAAA